MSKTLEMLLERFAGGDQAARQRGVERIVHHADHMAKRKGDLLFQVDDMDRETFDTVDAFERFDGKRAWIKTMRFRSQSGMVRLEFHTFEPPEGERFYGGLA